MRYLVKALFLLYTVIQLALLGNPSYFDIAIILILAAVIIFKEKYCNSILAAVFEFIIITYACTHNGDFTFLYGIIVEDAAYHRIYPGILLVAASGYYFTSPEDMSVFLLVSGVCGIYGYLSREFEDNKIAFTDSYDKERRYRYELEQAKAKLLNSSREAAHVAEIKERNRIAREIHDNAGHSIAGILLQLQASSKLFDRDRNKSKELLDKSIAELSGSLAHLRDTVHNIRPSESLGIEYIKKIVENYTYCPVNLKYTGDFNQLSASQLEMLQTNIKEALTNTSKYSKATKVEISIDINDRFIRLYIKDDGLGCRHIKEGLGISGMKERIANVGGSISISSDNGFMIVCIIPRDNMKGGGLFEGIDSR